MKNSGGGFDGFDDDGELIEYTPGKTFNIRSHAREFSEIMIDTGLNLVLHLRHVSVEFEAGCTPQEIIDGYFYAMQHKGKSAPSNCNRPDAPQPVV